MNPQATNPQTTNPQTTNPQTTNPQTNNPQTNNPQTNKPQTNVCAPSDCPCTPGQATFCGDETAHPKCLKGHSFKCDDNTGKACDNGAHASCAKCGGLTC